MNSVVRITEFAAKDVKTMRVIVPNKDLEIVCKDVDGVIGKPKDVKGELVKSTSEFIIPYKDEIDVDVDEDEINISDNDVEMKVSPSKDSKQASASKHEELKSPPKEEQDYDEPNEEPDNLDD